MSVGVLHSLDAREECMAVVLPRNAGMLVLGIWLLLSGLSGLVGLTLPSPVMAVLAFVAGLLILLGR